MLTKTLLIVSTLFAGALAVAQPVVKRQNAPAVNFGSCSDQCAPLNSALGSCPGSSDPLHDLAPILPCLCQNPTLLTAGPVCAACVPTAGDISDDVKQALQSAFNQVVSGCLGAAGASGSAAVGSAVASSAASAAAIQSGASQSAAAPASPTPAAAGSASPSVSTNNASAAAPKSSATNAAGGNKAQALAAGFGLAVALLA